MIAQLISQVSSHFIIHYHRRIVHMASGDYERTNCLEKVERGIEHESSKRNKNPRKDLLRAHRFSRPHRGEQDRLVVQTGTAPTIATACVTLTILLTIGCIIPSFSVEILGVVGILIESGQQFQQAISRHSVISIVRLIMEEAHYLGSIWDYLGLGTFSFLLVSTVLLVPIAQAICLVRQWFSPMNKKQRWRLSVTIESLQAWQYVEVYLLAILVAAWQLGPVSEFMINTYCESLSGTLSLLAYYGIIEANDAQCFRVSTGVESGTYILVVGAALLALMNTFVMKAVRQYEREQSAVVALLQETPEAAMKSFSEEDVTAARQRITPPPVLFTDTFRWFLVRENLRSTSNLTVESIQPNDCFKHGFVDSPIKHQKQNKYRVGQSVDYSLDQGVKRSIDAEIEDGIYDIYKHQPDSLGIMNPDQEHHPRPYLKNNYYGC